MIPGFQNFTGTTQADMLRLNVAIPPSASPNINGILGGDLAGFPNGRRVFDDVVTIELRAVAGRTIRSSTRVHAGRCGRPSINDGTRMPTDVSYLGMFPYLDHPGQRLRGPAAVGRERRDHDHDHDAPAPQPRPAGVHRARARRGAVLDIGGDIGALVVLMDDEPPGPSCTCGRRPTSARPSTPACGPVDQGAGHVTAALFCALAAGTYWVLDDAGDDVLSVAITGGELANADLRSARTAVTASSSSPHRLSASARRAMRSSAEAHRHTASTSSGSVVNIPVTHISAAAARWSSSARCGAEAGLVRRHQRRRRRRAGSCRAAPRRRPRRTPTPMRATATRGRRRARPPTSPPRSSR